MNKIPKFKNEEEESEFWDTHSSVDFLDDTTPVNVKFIGPRPRKAHISLRLDQETIDSVKMLAESQGIGYQTLMRMWIINQLTLQLESLNTQEAYEDPVLLKESLATFNKQTRKGITLTIRQFTKAFTVKDESSYATT